MDNFNQIENLVSKRLIAKSNKDWKLADEIRQELDSLGIVVEDKANGTSLWRKKY